MDESEAIEIRVGPATITEVYAAPSGDAAASLREEAEPNEAEASVAELWRCFAPRPKPPRRSRDASPRAAEDARAWEENQRMLGAARRRKWLAAALPWMLCAVLAAAGVWLLLRG